MYDEYSDQVSRGPGRGFLPPQPAVPYDPEIERFLEGKRMDEVLTKASTVARSRTPPGRGLKLPDELTDIVKGRNIGMPDRAFQPYAPTYYVPNPRVGVAGWTPPSGETFVVNAEGQNVPSEQKADFMAGVTAHERMHSLFRPRGMPLPAHMAGEDYASQLGLAANMEAIQPDMGSEALLWGRDPYSSPEEQIANLFGHEGSLPAGTPITRSPIASRLFADVEVEPGKVVRGQQMKDYYFGQSSLAAQSDAGGNAVGRGVWEGQAPDTRSRWQRWKPQLRQGMVNAGFNLQGGLLGKVLE